MIATIATLKVHEEKIAEFEKLFAELTRAVRANEPGTSYYQLFRHQSEPGTYNVVEVYLDELAADAHKASDHFRAIAPLMVKQLMIPPDMKYFDLVE